MERRRGVWESGPVHVVATDPAGTPIEQTVAGRQQGYRIVKARCANGYLDRPPLPLEQARLVQEATRLAVSQPPARDTGRAMSQENVELVREGFARWNEGDSDFFFNSTAPDIELLSRLLAIGGIDLRARGSGLDMKEPMGWVFEFRDGRVARMRFYAQPSEALEAVGLRE